MKTKYINGVVQVYGTVDKQNPKWTTIPHINGIMEKGCQLKVKPMAFLFSSGLK